MSVLRPLSGSRPGHAVSALCRHATIVALWLLVPSSALAAGPGAWSSLYRLREDVVPPGGDYSIAVHMAVVPAPGTSHHSRLVWWLNSNATAVANEAGVLGWNPASEDATHYPNQVFNRLDWNGPSLAPGRDLFCSSAVQTKSGELMTLGGTDDYQWGINDAWTYQPVERPSQDGWTSQGTMRSRRWYGSGLVLRDGRVFTSAGHKYMHLVNLGGRRNGTLPPAPTAYLVDRFARPDDSSLWDPPVETIGDPGPADRPAMPREAHSLAYLAHLAPGDFGGQILFGGRNGSPVNDGADLWYLKREDGTTSPPEFDTDYAYRWHKRTIPNPPVARSDHIALGIETDAVANNKFLPDEMVMFGGRDATGPVATDEMFWHLRKNNLNQWVWDRLSISGGPSRRYSHAACYVPSARKLYVFGGADANGVINSSSLHVFTFTHGAGSAATGTWSTVTLAGGSPVPEPRRDHTLVWAEVTNELLLFGGTFATASASDAKLWRLDLDAGSPSWVIVNPPADLKPRAGHTASFDWEKTHRLFVFGGDDPTAPGVSLDPFVWTFGVGVFPLTWQKRENAGFNLTEHAMNLDPHGLYFARLPEVFNPDAGGSERWIEHPAASWRQGWYQIQFAVPGNPAGGGRVVSVGASPQSYFLDVPAHGTLSGPWQAVPNGDAGMYPLTGAIYAPGKLMVAGGTLTYNQGGGLVGTTKTLDYSTGTTTGWQTCAPPLANEMAPRFNHNLVLLPDGKVLAVGGSTAASEEDGANPALAVHCPQMWDPTDCKWTPLNALACDFDADLNRKVVRNYHSVAVLLGDGRIVSAGGWPKADVPAGGKLANPHRAFARVYSPPYLFKANGDPIAASDRPAIAEAPCRLDWGGEFVIQTLAAADIAAGGKACLIRPAATTHSIDQNQRYVPLTVVDCPGGNRLRVQAPANGDHAPPGDYMLFLINSAGIPSIARWVRVGPVVPGGCDIVAPAQTSDFTVDYVWETGAGFYWSAPGDDGGSGTAAEYDLRRWGTSPSEGNFCAGSRYATTQPRIAGSWEEGMAVGLTPCTQHYAALKTRDEVANWAGLGNVEQFMTVCMGGGGGASAREAPPTLALGSGELGEAVPIARVPAGGRALVASMQPGEGAPVWTVHHLSDAEAASLAGSDSASVITQVPDGSGGWLTRARRNPAGSRFAIRSGRLERRFVFLGDFSLEIASRVVAAAAVGASRDLELVAARHSRLGDVKGAVEATGAYDLGLVRGDTLTLRYGPAGGSVADARDEFLRITAGSAQSQPSGRRRLGGLPPPRAVPGEFALYANQPNPFTRQTSIRFALPVPEQVRLQVFDLVGRRVRTLALGRYEPGVHTVVWDGRDEGGNLVPTGVYHCRLEAGRFQARRTMVMLP